MDVLTIGLLSMLLFFVLVAMGLPIALGMTISSIAGFVAMLGWNTTLTTMGSIFTTYMSNYTMTVIPAFILMGTLGHRSGILDDVFDVMVKWFGRLPGGLAIGAIGANAVFGACSGSTIAACVVIGKSSIPKMKEAGYPDKWSTGVVAASSTLANLIPPSILICVYGLLVSQSIGRLLIAGVIPGILSALIFTAYIVFGNRNFVALTKTYTWKEKFASLKYLWVVGIIILFVIGSMYAGIATPTEVGAVGSFGMFFLGVVTRKMTLSAFLLAVEDAVKISGAVLFLIVAAGFVGRLLVISNLSDVITQSLGLLGVNKYIVFCLCGVIFIILGCLMDALPMMIVGLPVIYPTMMSLGFDPIWFGIIVIKYCEIALISPPVGMALYATHTIAPEVPLITVVKGASPFLILNLLIIFILTVFPGVVTWLPNQMFG